MDLNDLVENLRPECKICYDKYSDDVMPKMLHCSHSFCKDCIQKLVDVAVHKNSSTIRCPCCRKRNKFQSSKGVDSFKNNLDLRNVAAMVPTSLLPDGVLSDSDSLNEAPSKDEADEYESFKKVGPCPKHGAEMNRYCTTCASTICNECVLAEHYEHSESITSVTEYAQDVKKETLDLLELARDLPFMRIKVAAYRTTKLALAKKEDLLKEVDRVVESTKVDIDGDSQALDQAKETLVTLGNETLDSKRGSLQSLNETEETTRSLLAVEEVIRKIKDKIKEREASSFLGLEFVGMKPDGSVGDFIKGKLNILGHVVDQENVFYVADNRKHDYVVLVGVAHVGDSKVSKWIMSFRTDDRSSPVVFSSQILYLDQQRLLLIAVGRTLYKINVALGKCIAEKIQAIHVKEGVILMEDASSINGIDWFPDEHKPLAILSLNTGKSLYLIDTVTKSLVKSISTSVTPSVLTCRKSDRGNFTIVRDNSSLSKLVILNNSGNVEYRIIPSRGLSDYIPWVSCWITAKRPSKVAVVWCKSHQWKIAIHDAKGKVLNELQENVEVAIPVSIAYNEQDNTFIVSSNEGTSYQN
ncbi:putative tripartite motif-containing protein 3 [Apostichopus japonicus]|uniref:Putative tripartite motif-containing protein 3 n=1 Tax=Stichopus japonicus TaxID=307972 RepID=A0A2G8L4X3_STIJA|nr:putative tripartite motif-containing protein 3 [Apostichopus japonicus]